MTPTPYHELMASYSRTSSIPQDVQLGETLRLRRQVGALPAGTVGLVTGLDLYSVALPALPQNIRLTLDVGLPEPVHASLTACERVTT